MNSNQAFFFLSFLTECFRPFLLQRRKIIESTISPFSRFLRSDFRSFRELNILSTLHWVGGRANIRSATSFSSWGYNSLTTKCLSFGLRFIFFPQGGRAVDPVLGEKIFWKFFFGLNRLKMVWNVKKAKKKFLGGPNFFF